MGLFVDTKNISIENKNLNRYIKEYKDNCYDVFYELSKLSSYWKDRNTEIFEENIRRQKEDNLLILDLLERINYFYSYVEEIYDNNKIG